MTEVMTQTVNIPFNKITCDLLYSASSGPLLPPILMSMRLASILWGMMPAGMSASTTLTEFFLCPHHDSHLDTVAERFEASCSRGAIQPCTVYTG